MGKRKKRLEKQRNRRVSMLLDAEEQLGASWGQEEEGSQLNCHGSLELEDENH